MLGLSEAELASPADWMARMHPDDVPRYRHTLAQHLKGLTPRFEIDTRYRSSDGTWRWARQAGVAQRHPDGRAYRLVGATGDVTEIKNHEREAVAAAAAHRAALALEDGSGNEERYALALQAVDENMYDWDVEAGTLYLSPSLRAMQELPAGATLQDWAARIHPEDRPYHRSMLLALFKGDIPRLDCEFRYCMPDGTVRWARQHGIVLRGPDGRARRMVGATGDITEMRQRAAGARPRQGGGGRRLSRHRAHPRGHEGHARQHDPRRRRCSTATPGLRRATGNSSRCSTCRPTSSPASRPMRT